MPTAPTAVLAGVLARALELAARLSSRPAAVVLVYHRLADAASEVERVLVPTVPPASFAAHLRVLRRRYDVVDASAVLKAAAARRRGGRLPVAVTFDDDLPEHAACALPLLRAAGIPATFFLTGAGIDGGRGFWWQALAAAHASGADLGPELGAAGLPVPDGPAGFATLGRAVERLTPPERRVLTARLWALTGAGATAVLLDGDGIRGLAAAGCSIGFHTRGHDPLTPLGDAALHDALRAGRAEVEQAAGAALTAIAYPHGAADGRVARAAAGAGFAAGFTTRPAATTAADAPLLLPRVELLAAHAGTFALALARRTHPFGRAGEAVLAQAARLWARTASRTS